VALLLLGVGVGCGGGGDTTSDITKAQFVKKANFICADYSGKRHTWGEEEFNPKQRQGSHVVGSPATEALEAELKELGEELLKGKFIPSMRQQQEDLESLGAPAGDEEKIETMLQNFEKGVDVLEERGFKGIFGDEFDQFDKESTNYGLHCKLSE